MLRRKYVINKRKKERKKRQKIFHEVLVSQLMRMCMITHTQVHILSSIAAAAGCYTSSTVAFDYGAAVKQSHKERSD